MEETERGPYKYIESIGVDLAHAANMAYDQEQAALERLDKLLLKGVVDVIVSGRILTLPKTRARLVQEQVEAHGAFQNSVNAAAYWIGKNLGDITPELSLEVLNN